MADDPSLHMETFSSTGLREEAPVETGSLDFVDTPTSLAITRASPNPPVFARLTVRIDPVDGNAGAGAARIALTDAAGERTAYSDPATVSSGTGIRTTGWQEVPDGFGRGEATVQIANARVTAATLELAVRHEI